MEFVCANKSGDEFLLILSVVSPVFVVADHDSLKCIMVLQQFVKWRP